MNPPARQTPKIRENRPLSQLDVNNLNLEKPRMERTKDGTLVKPGTSYVYVNSGYGKPNGNQRTYVHTTSVVREQYWACSKWSRAKQVLAITAAILVGALVGLTITLTILPREDTIIALVRGYKHHSVYAK